MNNEYTSPLGTISSTEDYEDYMLSKNKCPNCEANLEQIHEEPEYVSGLHCEICLWEIKF